MYINKKQIVPFTLMGFVEDVDKEESDPVLDAVQVEEQS